MAQSKKVTGVRRESRVGWSLFIGRSIVRFGSGQPLAATTYKS
jgi:hypothetical protein